MPKALIPTNNRNVPALSEKPQSYPKSPNNLSSVLTPFETLSRSCLLWPHFPVSSQFSSVCHPCLSYMDSILFLSGPTLSLQFQLLPSSVFYSFLKPSHQVPVSFVSPGYLPLNQYHIYRSLLTHHFALFLVFSLSSSSPISVTVLHICIWGWLALKLHKHSPFSTQLYSKTHTPPT